MSELLTSGDRRDQSFRSVYAGSVDDVRAHLEDGDRASRHRSAGERDAVVAEAFVRLRVRWWRVRDRPRWVRREAARVGVPRHLTPLDPDAILAEAGRRTARSARAAGLVAAGAALVGAVAVTVGRGESTPLHTLPRPVATSTLGAGSVGAGAPVSSAPAPVGPLEGGWTTRTLTDGDVGDRSGTAFPARVRVRVVIHHSVLEVRIGPPADPGRDLLGFESFSLTGHHLRLTAMASFAEASTYTWRIEGDRLTISGTGRNQAVLTAAPFVRDPA